MITAPILAWCTVLLGVTTALVLGWRVPKGFWATMGVLFVDALMGVGLGFALYFTFSFCLNAELCAQTSDRTVWSIALPTMCIPVYWLATLIGKASQFWKPSVAEPGRERSY